MADYDAWDGTQWVTGEGTNDDNDRGPCWISAEDNNKCCWIVENDFADCFHGSYSEGQWSHTNTNQVTYFPCAPSCQLLACLPVRPPAYPIACPPCLWCAALIACLLASLLTGYSLNASVI